MGQARIATMRGAARLMVAALASGMRLIA